MEFILGILFLFVIDIVLSVDNAILIASTTKDLEGPEKKWAQILGASGAVLLRLIFVFILIFAFELLQNTPIVYMLGGAMLIYISISITNKVDENHKVKSSKSLWKAVMLIMAGDVMMSFDNALIISEVAVDISNDNFWITATIVTIALALSLIIIIFFSSQLAKFMVANEWVVYIAAWLLLGVGIEMIMKDPLLHLGESYHLLKMFIAYSISGAIIVAKYYFLDRDNDSKESDDSTSEQIETKEKDAS